MRARCLLLALGLLLACAPAAAAHEGHGGDPDHRDTIREVQVDFAAGVQSGSGTASLGAGGLPLTHCGPALPTTDDTANAAHAPSLPQFKLVYAHASDRPNRYAAWRNALQANVSLIQRFLANESGGRKAARFDMGTAGCGAQYVDIQVVALPKTQAQYAKNFALVNADVSAAVGSGAGGRRNLLVLADRMSTNDSLFGQGLLHQGEYGAEEDAGNAHNDGGHNSIIWVPDNYTPQGDQSEGYWPEGLLHEMGHNLGAVNWAAPHSSQSATAPEDSTYSHCWDGYDLMCYDDGPAKGHPYETSHCAQFGGVMPQMFDCGRDDYFNPAPVSPSHFDDHWNTFDSVFLSECVEIAVACARTDSAVQVTSLPAVAGTARAFSTVTASLGQWTGAPALAHQWQREVDGDWEDVPGATGATLDLPDAWSGTHVRLRVTATGASTVEAAHSLPVEVAAPDRPAAPATKPTFSGVLERGELVTAEPGTWLRATSFTYQWHRWTGIDWVRIDGATSRAYRAASADVGRYLYVAIRAHNSGGWHEETSAVRGPIAEARAPAPVTAPSIGGSPRRDAELAVSTGTWDREVTSYAYRWQRNASGTWSDIAGATAATYRPGAADVGATVRALVKATGAGGSTEAASGAAGPVTEPQPPVAGTAPALTGTAKRTRTLTSTEGTWTGAASRSLRWQRSTGTGWEDVAGATAATYVLTAADVGRRIRAAVTAVNGDGQTTAFSNESAVVADLAPPVAGSAPAVTGTVKRTHTLTASEGTWSGDTARTLRWQRSTAAGWEDIAGATAITHTLAAADVGRRIRVVVTAENDDGTTTATSGETAAVADLTPPTLSAAPAVTGTAKRTHTLTSTEGTWTGATSRTLRWQRSTGTGWEDVAGATAATYSLTAADVGRRIRTVVTAVNADGETTAASNETAVVADLTPPALSGAPAVTGTAKRTHTLTSTEGTWTGATSRALRWQRSTDGGWEDIAGATAATYTLAAADVGRRIRTVVIAANADGESSATSNETVAVTELAGPVLDATPAVSGVAKRTHTLTSTEGTWTGDTSRTLRWQRSTGTGWEDIAGATAASYTLTAADVGHRIRAVVTAVNADGDTSAASNETAQVVDLAPPVLAAAPVVSGTAKRTHVLASSEGSWTGDTSRALRWQRSTAAGWEDVPGATAATYTLTAADVGRRMRTVVVATNADGETSAASNETAVVGDLAPPALSAAPAVTGTAKRTRVLTSTDGTWTSATSKALRWQRSTGAGWEDVAGATGATYTLTAADLGRRLRTVVVATNADGETAATSNETDLVSDLAPPDTSITGAPPASTEDASAAFTFAAVGATGFDCRLDGGAWDDCASPLHLTGLAAGDHVVEVRAINADGVDATPAQHRWTITPKPAPVVEQPAPVAEQPAPVGDPPVAHPPLSPPSLTPPAPPAVKPPCAGLAGTKLAACRRAEALKKALAKCDRLKPAAKRRACAKREKALSKCQALKGSRKRACVKRARRL